MDKYYIEGLKKEYIEKIDKTRKRIAYLLKYLSKTVTNEFILDSIKAVKKDYYNGESNTKLYIPNAILAAEPSEELKIYILELKTLLDENPYAANNSIPENIFSNLLDSEPIHFKSDIVITDPCYLIVKKEPDYSKMPTISKYFSYKQPEEYPDFDISKSSSETYINEKKAFKEAMKEWEREEVRDDWEYCSYGKNLSVLGINNYICRDTIYGDWSCSVFDVDAKKVLGQFCADAGMVCICQLDEVLKYNPSFKEWIDNHNGCAAVISDFEGTVYFKVVKEDEDCYGVQVIGNGKNIKTGSPINFISSQTSL